MKYSILIFVLLLSNFLHGQNYPLSDPTNTGKWFLNPWVSDEFDGTELNRTKWWILGENNDYRTKWKGRAPGQFVAHNVKVENGNLVLTSQWEPGFNFIYEKQDGTYYGGTATAADNSKPITQACVMSETFFRYGYMEIRCKIADAPVTSAFWTTGYHSEIDMVENYGKLPIGNPEGKPTTLEKKFRTNMINWDPDRSVDQQNWKVEDIMNDRLASNYFVYGFEWDANYIKTYFNGTLIRSASRQQLESNDQWRHDYPQELWIDSEVFSWFGLPSAADLATPAEFKIDYIRVWQKQLNDPNFNALGFEGPFYFQGRSVQWWAAASTPWRIKKENASTGDFSLRFKGTGPFSGSYTMYSPFGSCDLPAGDNQMKFKVWIDPATTVNSINVTLKNPSVTIPFDISGIAKGTWVEVSENFTRNSASVLSLTNGDRIQITINASDISGSEALLYIDDISFTHINKTGVNNIPSIDMSVYPNPADDDLRITAIPNGTIQIFNQAGNLVKSCLKDSTTKKIDIKELTAGIYIIKLYSENQFGVKKVVVK